MNDSSEARRNSDTQPSHLDDMVQDHYQLLYRYAYRLSGNHADAEDLTQQTFLQAQRHWDQLRQPAAAKAWLCQILRSTYAKLIRRRRPAAAIDMSVCLEQFQQENDEIDENEFLDRERLQQALDELPDVFRVTLLMFYFEFQSYEAIAEELQVPLGTVMSRISRAKGHLRTKLRAAAARCS